MKKFNYNNSIVVITGAASGIGEALSFQLTERGAKLVIVDINSDGLSRVANEIDPSGERVLPVVMDVIRPDAPERIYAAAMEKFGKVDLLINNAGAALYGDFLTLPIEDFEWLIQLNFLSHVRMTKYFLPELIKTPGSHIANISSIFGVLAPALQTAYSSSKFALRGFTEALSHELAEENYDMGISAVLPGGVKTGIAKNARIPDVYDQTKADQDIVKFDQNLALGPDRAAATILDGIQQRKRRITVGMDSHAGQLLGRFFPSSYWGVLKKQVA